MVGVGIKIKKIRELKNFTQEYMAKELGISQSQYSNYETQGTDVRPDMLRQIAEILEVTPEQIQQFDDRAIFNNFYDGAAHQNCGIGSINNYFSDPKVIELLERNLQLLEEQTRLFKEQLKKNN